MDVSSTECPVCTGMPSVVVAVAHRALRQLIVELLDRDEARWRPRAAADQPDLAEAIREEAPDLVILDAAYFARFCDSVPTFPPHRVIIIGPEPDAAYERAARRRGAGAWLCRDRVGEDLSSCMCRVLGCTRAPLTERFHPCPYDAKDRR
jgi:DNA-binding NarL/FixJ family response regulator